MGLAPSLCFWSQRFWRLLCIGHGSAAAYSRFNYGLSLPRAFFILGRRMKRLICGAPLAAMEEVALVETDSEAVQIEWNASAVCYSVRSSW